MEENHYHHPPRKKADLIVLHNLMGPDSEITKAQYESNKSRIDAVREAQDRCKACTGRDCAQPTRREMEERRRRTAGQGPVLSAFYA